MVCDHILLDTRGAIGVYDPGEDRYTLYADVNYPHRVRNMLANDVLGVPESNVRVVVEDVGGGHGIRVGDRGQFVHGLREKLRILGVLGEVDTQVAPHEAEGERSESESESESEATIVY